MVDASGDLIVGGLVDDLVGRLCIAMLVRQAGGGLEAGDVLLEVLCQDLTLLFGEADGRGDGVVRPILLNDRLALKLVTEAAWRSSWSRRLCVWTVTRVWRAFMGKEKTQVLPDLS